jgi:hypothetical protein
MPPPKFAPGPEKCCEIPEIAQGVIRRWPVPLDSARWRETLPQGHAAPHHEHGRKSQRRSGPEGKFTAIGARDRDHVGFLLRLRGGRPRLTGTAGAAVSA